MKEIITGWKGYDEARRALDEAEEQRDKDGLPVPGYEPREERPDPVNRRVMDRAEYAARLEEEKMKAITHRMAYALRHHIRSPAIKHLWADRMLNKIELRDGNPPPDADRPEWLKGLDLVVDPARNSPGGKLPRSLFAEYHKLKEMVRKGGGPAFIQTMEKAKASLYRELGIDDDAGLI